MDYRKKISIKSIKLPEAITEEDRGIKECCCKFKVYADLTNSESKRNDFTGVFVKKSDESDTVEFTISKNGETLTNQGETGIFPNDSYAVGYIFDWNRILSLYGAGCYTISVNYSISGISGSYSIGEYFLQPFNLSRVDGTCRIMAKYNSYDRENDIDFTGSNFKTTIRFNGYFGLMKPNVQDNRLIGSNRRVEKVTREYLTQYTLTAERLRFCASTKILELLKNEDSLFISDFNSINHSYQYNETEVAPSGNIETNYPNNGRLMTITAEIGDRNLLRKSYYNV